MTNIRFVGAVALFLSAVAAPASAQCPDELDFLGTCECGVVFYCEDDTVKTVDCGNAATRASGMAAGCVESDGENAADCDSSMEPELAEGACCDVPDSLAAFSPIQPCTTDDDGTTDQPVSDEEEDTGSPVADDVDAGDEDDEDDTETGCNQTPASTPGLFALALLALAVRRRR